MQTAKLQSGSKQNSLQDKKSCEICEGSGFYRIDVPFGDPRFGKLIRCDCRSQEDAERLQRLSNLTELERTIRLDDIEIINRPGTALMVQECADFVTDPVRMLTIWGGPGNAKTMALQAVVNQCLDAGLQAVYITSFDLFAHIKSAFNLQREVVDDSSYSRLKNFERVQILAIDEFDKIRVTDWVIEHLTDLIDVRYRFSLGTLIAMNSNPNTQTDWIYSRLRDGRNRIIYNQDSDIRPHL